MGSPGTDLFLVKRIALPLFRLKGPLIKPLDAVRVPEECLDSSIGEVLLELCDGEVLVPRHILYQMRYNRTAVLITGLMNEILH